MVVATRKIKVVGKPKILLETVTAFKSFSLFPLLILPSIGINLLQEISVMIHLECAIIPLREGSD